LLIGGGWSLESEDIELAKSLARELYETGMAKTSAKNREQAEHLAIREDLAAYPQAALAVSRLRPSTAYTEDPHARKCRFDSQSGHRPGLPVSGGRHRNVRWFAAVLSRAARYVTASGQRSSVHGRRVPVDRNYLPLGRSDHPPTGFP